METEPSRSSGVLRDEHGIRIVACPDKQPHKRHGWVAANEDLRCTGVSSPVARYLPGLDLPETHPLAGRGAWQCSTCRAIFYPAFAPPSECPYCNESDE